MSSHQRKQAQRAYLSTLNTPTQDLTTFQRMVNLAGQFNADLQERQTHDEWEVVMSISPFHGM